MDFKIDKKTEETQGGNSGGKGRQNILLLVLLVLAGAASYLYFFTDMINPQNTQKPAETPLPQTIKKPLPPREGEAAKSPAPAADKQPAAAGKPEPAKVVPAAPVAKTPAAAPVSEQKPKAKQEPKKVEAPKPAVAEAKGKKAPAVAVAKKETKKLAKKPAVAKSDTGGLWTLLVGSYVIESNMSTDLAKVKKAGFEPAIKAGGRKKTTMNRLVLAEYADLATATSELKKLKRHTSDAFVIGHGGKHTVYAGSYILDSRAKAEKERLAAAGYALNIKRVEVAIPSKKLTAGVFSDRKSAEAALKKLKGAGLKASLIRQ